MLPPGRRRRGRAIARILDTKHLEWFFASEPLLEEVARDPLTEIAGPAEPIAFDERGDLVDRFPA